MNYLHLHILTIASLVSCACAIPGVFLVLRGIALMSDAISHAILPGIVLMFLFVHQLASPLLIVGASLAGIATVMLTELLIQTKRLKKDAAIGLVFPLFFSVGVLLISMFTRDVHLDTDMVLLGELAFAPFNRLIIFGIDCGPYALWTLATLMIVNFIMLALFYKELALTTFDHTLAHTLGFSPTRMYYGLMTITSITTVAAFDSVGSIVVVALTITPAATAYLITRRLPTMIAASIGISMSASLVGYSAAALADVSIAGSIAVINGFIFCYALLFAPRRGIVARLISGRKRSLDVCARIVQTHCLRTGTQHTTQELANTFGWTQRFTQHVLKHQVDQLQ